VRRRGGISPSCDCGGQQVDLAAAGEAALVAVWEAVGAEGVISE
jgi:hypothetical protein